MAQELYNQPLINDPDAPSDDDRIALGQPSVAGAKNLKWSRLKELLGKGSVVSDDTITGDGTSADPLSIAEYAAKKGGNESPVFENTKLEAFAPTIILDASQRSVFEIEITGNTTINVINHVDGQFPTIKYTINTDIIPTIILAPTFIAFDDAASLPNANGDKAVIIGESDGVTILWDVKTKKA